MTAPLAGLDANLFDGRGAGDEAEIERLLRLARAGRIRLFAPSGVQAEMRHFNAPATVRQAAAGFPDAPPRPLTARQHIDRLRVRAILRGDGKPGKHDADAAHLSEAAEAGCRYFLTRDGKMLRKRDILRAALPPALEIATPTAFLAALGGTGDA